VSGDAQAPTWPAAVGSVAAVAVDEGITLAAAQPLRPTIATATINKDDFMGDAIAARVDVTSFIGTSTL
jgi:hypothetical protein